MVVAGAIGGALWASIPALLRTKFNANEILVSLMLVYIAQLGVSWLVHGPWKDPEGFNFPQTEDVSMTPRSCRSWSKARASTRLSWSRLGALLAGYVFMHRSFMGFQMQVAGEAEAARALCRLFRQADDLDRTARRRRDGRHRRHGRSVRPDGTAHRARVEQLRLRGDHRGLRRPAESRSASSSRAC